MADAADHAQELAEVHMAAALRLRRQQAAERGDGMCRTCGEPIAPARLAALPSARLCIACASASI